MNIPVSVLILTKDEELNIARCLASVSWSDDVVVLDSGSTDRTTQIALAKGARVLHREFDNFAAQRNHGVQAAGFKYDWVLHLDADEVVTGALAEEISRAVKDDSKQAYQLASKLMFMGRWLRFAGMFPVYQVRLGHRDLLRFRQSGHGQREISENLQIGTLREPYEHFNFSKGLVDWVEKHNRYSSDEAEMELREDRRPPGFLSIFTAPEAGQRRRALKQLAARLPCRPTLRFIYMYILRLGFLDGRAGLAYCRLMSNYELWIVLKREELKRERSNTGGSPGN